MTRGITEIFEDCMENCQTFKKIDWQMVFGSPKYRYSVSEEVVAFCEDNDLEGILHKYCVNEEEISKHNAKWEGVHREHVMTCDLPCCIELREYRKNNGVPGYD